MYVTGDAVSKAEDLWFEAFVRLLIAQITVLRVFTD